MKKWEIEQDYLESTIRTLSYEVEADTLAEAIAIVEGGTVKSYDERTYSECDSKSPTYDDSRELET